MRKNKLLLLLALLMTAATGAWAAAENENIIFNNLGLANAYDLTSATLTVGNINLDFAKGTGSSIPAFYTSGGGTARLYKGNTMSVDASGATITKIVFTYASEVTPEFSTGSYNSSTKTWEGEATTLTVTNAYTTNTQIRITSMDVYYSAASGYTVSLNDGTENPTTWTASTDGTNFGALPIGGLKGDGSETVTLKYNGRLKVKSVTATSDAAPAAPTGNIVDLSTLTADYEAQEGDVLTGTLDGSTQPYKITIADGATVTLDGATINGVNNDNYEWAGITCLGDATIILKDGSENTVKGFYEDYPGIHVLTGKTLIIKGGTEGTGKLTASPFDGGGTDNSYGAGIGGGYTIACGDISIEGGVITATGGFDAAGIGAVRATCGNISITGGTITATGGYDAAGIGSGNGSTCGNITITGGDITATGGNEAPGIGSGYDGSCGNITIANTVTKVTATKGSYAPYSIGAGDYGTSGTVTIGGNDGAISESPYTYQP